MKHILDLLWRELENVIPKKREPSVGIDPQVYYP